MRYMMLIKATEATEAGVLPTEEQIAAMGRYNEELVKAGVLLAGDGLQASSKGARVKYSSSKPTVVDGPFAETKELIAGYWIIQVRSKEEAIEWAKRIPFGRAPFPEGGEVEVRQMFDVEDFGDAATPELREQEGRLRAQAEKNAGR